MVLLIRAYWCYAPTMQLLLSILTDSFIIWTRNFSLVYVILLAMLLIGFLTPKEMTSGTNTQLLLFMGSILLLMTAFTAGWFNMIAAACRRYFERSPTQKSSPGDDFMQNISLFKYFLSGISLHFIPVALSFMIGGLILFLLSFTLQPLVVKVFPIFQEILKHGSPDQAQLMNLPAHQRVLLEEFSLGLLRVMLLFAGFNLITALWPVYVTQYGDNIFKAYWHSLLRFFKDPLRFLLFTGLLITSQILFPLLSAAFAGNILLGAIAQLGGVLFSIYAMVTLFVYVSRTSERPLCILEAEGEEPEAPDDSNPPEQNEPPSF